MVQLNLSYTKCFLQEPVADYLYCMPMSLVDLCLTGTQIYNTSIVINALVRLKRLEHLRINGLATINDFALEKVNNFNSSRIFFYSFCFFKDLVRHRSSIENVRNQWLHHDWFGDRSEYRTDCSSLSITRRTFNEFTQFYVDVRFTG